MNPFAKAQLVYSLGKHGGDKMNAEATRLWQKILSQSADIPFSEVFVQYDDYGESFYMSYRFKSNRWLEATMYVDEKVSNVYFSVYSGNERFYQSYLPQGEFFTKSVELWTSVNGERG